MKRLAGCLLLALSLAAPARAAAGREFLHVAPFAATPPAIDGELDEPAWRNAPAFDLRTPPSSGRIVKNVEEAATSVRMLHDAEGIYLGIVCRQNDLSALRAAVKARDGGNVWEDDSVELFFSPRLSKINYYKFDVNSLGVFADTYRHDAVLTYADWNALNVRAAAGRRDDAWTIEFFVSWKDLAAEPAAGDFIGFQMTRFLWKGAELHANGNTGGNYGRPKMGFVYLAGAAVPATREIAEKMEPLIPDAWFVVDGDGEWIYSDKREIAVGPPEEMERRFSAKLGGLLEELPDMKSEAEEIAKEPDRRRRFTKTISLLDRATLAMETKELQDLLD